MKATVEIDVPEGWEVARLMKDMEWRDSDSSVRQLCYTAILRPAWQWPAWLTCPYIAMDRHGRWFAFRDRPQLTDRGWVESHSMVDHWFLAFTPPPCTDWRQSLRQNPNWKGSE